LENQREILIQKARDAMKLAYSKYSNFQVGSAILTSDNQIFTGCNIENISFGVTICAERVAFFKAVSEGYRKFKAIALTSSGKDATFPCGACRQVLSEFGDDIIVYVDKDPKDYDLSELLPHSFSEKSLENL
jgi:cytidine deaminase